MGPPSRRLPGDGLRMEQPRGAGAPPAAAAAPPPPPAATWPAGPEAGRGSSGGGITRARVAVSGALAPGSAPWSRLRPALAGTAALLAAGLRARPGMEHLGPHPELGPPGLRLLQPGHRSARLLGAHWLRALLRLHVAHGQEG